MTQMRIDKISFGDYCRLFGVLTAQSREHSIEWLKKRPKPWFVAGVQLPQDLNMLTYGQLCDIQDCGKDLSGLLDAVCVILPNVSKERLMKEKAAIIVGAVTWIGKEIERINKVFERIAPRYTTDQIAAGVKMLQFGTFGVLDWYAKRQGITDQNEVRNVPWVRIWQCMKNDKETGEYEQRLQQVITNKLKSRK